MMSYVSPLFCDLWEKHKRSAWSVLLPILLSACSGVSVDTQSEGENPASGIVGSLPGVDLDAGLYETVTTEDAIQAYMRLKANRHGMGMEFEKIVDYRLADLVAQKSDGSEESIAIADDQRVNLDLIQRFEKLLSDYPGAHDNDYLLYQLSKRHELAGNHDKAFGYMSQLVEQFPESRYLPEVQFRRGEVLFNDQYYKEAQEAFGDVIKAGQQHSLYDSALYMKGWSQFKSDQFDLSLETFAESSQKMLGHVDTLALVQNGALSLYSEEALGDRHALIDDQLRVMSYAVGYLDGADSLKTLFDRGEYRNLEPILYDYYASQLIEKKRTHDAIDVYRQFVRLHPGSAEAPWFQQRLIGLYIHLKQPNDVLVEKVHYVTLFGPTTDYWKNISSKPDWHIENLRAYTLKMANFHHVAAQDIQRGSSVYGPLDHRSVSLPAHYQKRYGVLYGARSTHLTHAIVYYDRYLNGYPQNNEFGGIVFKKAEAQFSLGMFEKALDTYYLAAYGLSQEQNAGFTQQSDAGYSVITAYLQLEKQQKNAKKTADESKQFDARIASQIRFVDSFPQDQRAFSVQKSTTELLYHHGDYEQTIDQGQRLLGWPSISRSEKTAALWILGQSHFKLKHFNASASISRELVSLLTPAMENYDKARELLAASIYEQSQIELQAKNTERAVELLLSIAIEVPESDVNVSAQYDAASHLIGLQNWSAAASVLERFRTKYRAHPFSETIPEKLAFVYEKQELWANAAKELLVISEQTVDLEKKQKSLFQAGSYFEKAGETGSAIAAFRSYAHGYPEPLDLNVEAQYKLSQFYSAAKEPLKQRFWLKKLIDTHKRYGERGGDRLVYLAAEASNVFADDKYYIFQQAKLKVPLAKSLKEKKKAFNQALIAYQATADYGVAPFASRATYRIGEIYANLSKELMNSERPKGLDELELEQYEILLEEQAYPFEESAIEIHEVNAQRSWHGDYDEWIQHSFRSLSKLHPVRYNKPPRIESFVELESR